MPAIAAHHFFGHSVLEQLPPALQLQAISPELESVLHQAFDWGCQGPDILFYHLFPTGRRENFGAIFHREKIPQSFFYLTRTVCTLSAPYEAHLLFAYLMGYVCHYCLDRQVHPYINDRCRAVTHPNRELSPTIQHRLLEADLDRAYIQKYAPEIPVRDFRLDRLHLTNYDVIHPIGLLLTGLGRNLFGLRTSPAKIEESMRLMNHLQTILHDPTGKKRGLYFQLEKLAGYPDFFTALIPPEVPLGVDTLNQSRRPWKGIRGQEQRDTYWELEEQARESALSLICRLDAAGRYGEKRKPGQAILPFPSAFFYLDYLGRPVKS